MQNQSFPRQARIIKTDDFSSVFSFRKRISGQFLAIHYQASQSGRARLGMVVAKKVAKRSVDRNYMRRVLRELFRKQQMQIAALDLVIRVMKPFNHQDFTQLEQEFTELLFRLKRAAAKDAAVAQSESHHV
ncbi:MAG: ribonuclease P protein component [Betaproteobacteria bacterium HGW-Betaproteobacteria-1]|nr:MAG: ribonuclease P protein component [Betaproteobacteria bacterium HGW-Betaproteobacteria-1]